jgi:hypothetical protein
MTALFFNPLDSSQTSHGWPAPLLVTPRCGSAGIRPVPERSEFLTDILGAVTCAASTSIWQMRGGYPRLSGEAQQLEHLHPSFIFYSSQNLSILSRSASGGPIAKLETVPNAAQRELQQVRS